MTSWKCRPTYQSRAECDPPVIGEFVTIISKRAGLNHMSVSEMWAYSFASPPQRSLTATSASATPVPPAYVPPTQPPFATAVPPPCCPEPDPPLGDITTFLPQSSFQGRHPSPLPTSTNKSARAPAPTHFCPNSRRLQWLHHILSPCLLQARRCSPPRPRLPPAPSSPHPHRDDTIIDGAASGPLLPPSFRRTPQQHHHKDQLWSFSLDCDPGVVVRGSIGMIDRDTVEHDVLILSHRLKMFFPFVWNVIIQAN